MSSSAAQRRRTAYAAAAAAKQRRNKVLAIIGFVLFLGVLAYEVPHTLKLLNKHSSTAVVVPPPAAGSPRKVPKQFRTAVAPDPFTAHSFATSDPVVGPAVGGHDPFAHAVSATSSPATTPPPPTLSTAPLPKQIVIGTPTKNGSVARGWIVILASIPTREGRGAALAFARIARTRGVAPIAVLNSSNRKPLRGGYWVVYTAPVPSVVAASRRANEVHNRGYGTAYLRELIVYH